METNLKLMKCGNCGNETLRIFQGIDRFILECESCKSTSKIYVERPKIIIGWPEQNSRGIFTVFEK